MQRRTEEDFQNYMEILGLAKKKNFCSKLGIQAKQNYYKVIAKIITDVLKKTFTILLPQLTQNRKMINFDHSKVTSASCQMSNLQITI
jgi:hypothetical protein